MNVNNFKLRDLGKILNLSEENIKKRIQFFSDFNEIGFPSKNNEEWKFIDLEKKISSNIPQLKFFDKILSNKVDKNEVLKYMPLDTSNFNQIISVNGFIKNVSLNHENKNKFEIIRKPDESKLLSGNSLNNLNNALYLDYIKIVVKDGYTFNKPIIVVNLSLPNVEYTNLNQRFDILLEKNSCLTLLDLNLNNSKKSFFNVNNNFILKAGSILKNYKIDIDNSSNLYYSKTNIDLYENSVSENFVFSSGPVFAKNEIECNLKENHSSAFVNGVINLNEEKQHEIRSKINHLSENSKSYQLIKCALKDKSKAVYQGKIYVDSIAQKTDGYQLSKAVLLNEGTEFNGKPELEIYADDVKCSHGSSSGNLDENKIFYLMTRGLNRIEAKKILLDGFFLEVINKITDDTIKNIIKELMGIK